MLSATETDRGTWCRFWHALGAMNPFSGSSSTLGARPVCDCPNGVNPTEFIEFSPAEPGWDPSGLRTQRAFSLTPSCDAEARAGNGDFFERTYRAMSDLQDIAVGARAATRAEQAMTFLAGFRLYPKAILWSILLSSTIIMEGYDTTLITSFFSLPVFRRAYGTPTNSDASPAHTVYEISSAWQGGLSSMAVVGEILGLFINGYLADRIGYRYTMMGALVWLSLAVFLSFFAVSIKMLLAAQFLCGIPWGIFQTLSTTYAAEVMPVALRAYLLSNVNMCWLLGQICGVSIIRGLVNNTSEWSYRLPFGLQWAFAIPILIGVFFAPESPWWLVRHERPDEARKALLRLTSSGNHDFNVDETLAMMKHTNEFEKYLGQGEMSYADCFKGRDLRRTEIACLVWVSQALCGSSLTGFAAYFYEQAGFSSPNAFNLAVGMYGMAIIGGIISWFLFPTVGRRKLYVWGLLFSLIILVVTGSVGALPESRTQSWTLGSLLILLTFVYDMTIGPVCYVLVAEIPSTRLRVKTVVLARVTYNIASIMVNTLTPRMLNPTAWNWKGKSCFLYAGMSFVCLLWCYWRLPEPFGLSYLEIDILFERKAKAKQFRQFQVNLANMGYFNLLVNERRSTEWRGY